MYNDKIRINFEFEGTLDQLESAIMRIAMHPAESGNVEQVRQGEPEAEKEIKPPSAVKPVKKSPPQERYAKTITVEMAKNIIAKRNPATIQAAIAAILEDSGVTGSALSRMLGLKPYDINYAAKGAVYPKTGKAFANVLNFPPPIPLDGPLSLDRIKAIIAATKPTCLAALITELKKRYALYEVGKLMSVTTEALIDAEKGKVSSLLLKVFQTRFGFPAAITE